MVSNRIQFEFQIIRNKYLPDELLLGIAGIENQRFRFKAESWYDRLFKFLRVSREHQTNDVEFDEKVYIVSDDSRLHSLISNRSGLIESVLDIFNHPTTPGIRVKEIRNNKGKIWVRYAIPNEFTDVGILGFAEKPVSSLDSFVNGYRDWAKNTLAGSRDPFIFKAVLVLAISSGLAINGALQSYRIVISNFPFTVDSSMLFKDAIWIGSGITLALIFIAFVFLRRSSRTHLVVLELLVMGLFGAVSTTYANLHDANIDLDTSQPMVYEVKVLDKKVSRSRSRNRRFRSPTYSVFTQDWNKQKSKTRFHVSNGFFHNVSVGDQVLIVQRLGHLNYRWVERIEKKP